MRVLVLGLALICLAVMPVQARADVAFCDGKYQMAAQMLDAAYAPYGTLYSSGPNEQDDGSFLGPTIDVWRLLQGLPDQRFRDAGQFDYSKDWGADYSAFGTRKGDLNLVLHIADREGDYPISLFHRYFAARFLNSLVPAGTGAGWWLVAPPKKEDPYASFVRSEAKPHSLMEWLLIVMADSDMPHAIGRAFAPFDPSRLLERPQSPAVAAVIDLVQSRQAGGKGWAWWVARSLFDPDFSESQELMARRVNDCSASPAEYAANAIWQMQNLLFHPSTDLAKLDRLPPAMQRKSMADLAVWAMLRARGDPAQVDEWRAFLSRLAERAPDTSFTKWLSVGRSWLARDVAELASVQPEGGIDRRVWRSLNLLSLDDLMTFATTAPLSLDQTNELRTIIASRAFVLGRLADARKALEGLRAEGSAQGQRIAAALAGGGSEELRVARAILALPKPSLVIGADKEHDFPDTPRNWDLRNQQGDLAWHDFDLPFDWQTGQDLDANFRWWLREPFSGATGRAYGRGRAYHSFPEIRFVTPLPEYFWTARSAGAAYLPFARMIAIDEVGRFGVCSGLTAKLSRVLVDHVRNEGAGLWGRIFADREELAQVLGDVITINRHSPGALLDGQPAGQQAYALLQTRFADTEVAKSHRYWYFADNGC